MPLPIYSSTGLSPYTRRSVVFSTSSNFFLLHFTNRSGLTTYTLFGQDGDESAESRWSCAPSLGGSCSISYDLGATRDLSELRLGKMVKLSPSA